MKKIAKAASLVMALTLFTGCIFDFNKPDPQPKPDPNPQEKPLPDNDEPQTPPAADPSDPEDSETPPVTDPSDSENPETPPANPSDQEEPVTPPADSEDSDEPEETPPAQPENYLTAITATEVFYAIDGWNPSSSYTLSGDYSQGYTLTLPSSTDSLWKAQLKLATDADVITGHAYEFKATVTSSADLEEVTFKFQKNGSDDTSNATYLFEKVQEFSIPANVPTQIVIKAISKVDITDGLLVMDFGKNPAATITISNFSLTDAVVEEKKTGTAEVTDVAPETITVDGKTYTYVWSDEFTQAEANGTPLKSKWNYDVGRGMSYNTDGTYTDNWTWGNNELQWYSNADPDNTFVSNGTLKINAIKEAADAEIHEGAEWTSGRLVTRNIPGATFKYGYIEMKAKIPYDAGVWPAFWMLDNDIYNGQGWPLSGEIDIMETSVNQWDTKVYGTIHCGAGTPIFSKGTDEVGFENNLFHTYAVDWTENDITWYYDGVKLFTYTPDSTSNEAQWPFNEEFYIIMNLAVGGNLGLNVPADLTRSTMEVDYVRVYQKQ